MLTPKFEQEMVMQLYLITAITFKTKKTILNELEVSTKYILFKKKLYVSSPVSFYESFAFD